jgi:hypothetical protein
MIFLDKDIRKAPLYSESGFNFISLISSNTQNREHPE